jgi:FkbM family methyltransferase
MRLDPRGWIVDVGAHIGAFVLKARSLFPENPIVAVEPVPANYRLLARNVERNACGSTTLLKAAITETRGPTRVYLDPSNSAGHSTVVRPSAASLRAEGLTLSALLARCGIESVALLKIDCEGAEYGILRHAPAALWSRVSNVAVEYHPVPGHDFAQLQAQMSGRGFELAAHKTGYLAGQGTALFRNPAR